MAMKMNPTCNSIMHEMFYFIMISLLIKNAPTQKPKRDQQTATTRKKSAATTDDANLFV